MKRFICLLCAIFPLSAFADGVCQRGYTEKKNIPEEYEYSVIPSEYVELEYIESSGTQYINTNIDKTNFDGFDLIAKASAGSFTSDQFIITTKQNTGPRTGYGVEYSMGKWYYYSNVDIYVFNNIIGNKNSDNSWRVSVSDSLVTLYFNGDTLTLFGGLTTERNFRGSAQYIKIYTGGELAGYFIPAKRLSDDVVGMYDTVSKTFFENSGSGEFIPGPEKEYNTTDSDNVNCIACPYNTYKPTAGNEDCTPCPSGTFSPIGSTSLSDCAKILHVGEYIAYMPVGRRTEHGLCTMFNGEKYCADVYKKQ